MPIWEYFPGSRRALQERELAVREDAENRRLARELAVKQYEREGQAAALTRFLMSDPERARRFGYLEETPEPAEGAMYSEQGPRTTTRPVSPEEAPTLSDLMKHSLASEERIRIEGFKEGGREKRMGMRGEQASALQAQKDKAAMERLEKSLQNRLSLKVGVDNLRLKIEEMRQRGQDRRLSVSERGKNIRASLNPEVQKLLKERMSAREDLAMYQGVLADPESTPADRVNAQRQIGAIQDSLMEVEEVLDRALRLSGEAERAIPLGPATTPPTERPGPNPPAKANFKFDPASGRIIPVR